MKIAWKLNEELDSNPKVIREYSSYWHLSFFKQISLRTLILTKFQVSKILFRITSSIISFYLIAIFRYGKDSPK